MGYLLGRGGLLEFLESAENWKQWKTDADVEEPHALFISSFTHGVQNFSFIASKYSKLETNHVIAAKLDNIAHGAFARRILPVTHEIMSYAAAIYDHFHTGSEDQERAPHEIPGIVDIVNLATAVYNELTLVVSRRYSHLGNEDLEFVKTFAPSFQFSVIEEAAGNV